MTNQGQVSQSETAWARVSWDIQNYILFYLRSRQIPITASNMNTLAEVIDNRLRRGPTKHAHLDVVIDHSAAPCVLEQKPK